MGSEMCIRDSLGHQRRQRLERRLVGRAQAVEHQLEDQRVGGLDDLVPELQGVHLPLDAVVGAGQPVEDVGEPGLEHGAPSLGGEGGHRRPDREPGLQHAPRDARVEVAAAHQQPREQVEDVGERQVHALEFWHQVVEAADSLVFQLMFNSLRAAYEPALEALAPLMAEEVGQVHAYRVLTAAIGAGDPDTARAAADRVLRPATESLLSALAALEEEK